MEYQTISQYSVLFFELTPLLAKPGWYYKKSNNGHVSGPFPNRRRAEVAVDIERRSGAPQERVSY